MQTAIFWPMIVQAALTHAIYILMSKRRIGAVRAGKATPADYRVPIVEPEPSATAARSLVNQFELPVLFFAVCLSLYVTNGVTVLVVVLAWAFVLLRLAHAAVHVTVNRLRIRRQLFAAGYVIDLALWVLLALHIL